MSTSDIIIAVLNFPMLHPTIFLIAALLWSAFQGYTGHRYGLYICDSAYKKACIAKPKEHVRHSAYGFHHGAFYFVCSLSGFIAWHFAVALAAPKLAADPITTAQLALAVFAFLGVSGALPRILYLGKWPG